MAEESYLAALTYASLFEPVFEALTQNGNRQMALRLREALRSADAEMPGFLLQLVRHVINDSDHGHNVDIFDTVLRIQNRLPKTNFEINGEKKISDSVVGQLAEKCHNFRKTLSRIPLEINDYRTFVNGTLADIATDMKSVLSAIDNFRKYLRNNLVKSPITESLDERDKLLAALERSRKDFVSSCRDFVSLLQELVDNKVKDTDIEFLNSIYANALRVIFQMLCLVQSVKNNLQK